VEVRFIEFMPFQNNNWSQREVVKKAEMMKRITGHFEIRESNPDYNSTSSDHCKVVGYEGSFSFITTLSNPFCASCSRLRISADGKMRNCLFAKSETDLVHVLRTGNNLSEAIEHSVATKEYQWGGQELNCTTVLHEMKLIGG
jgi:cyclic pyranopterin phosphate synthase